MADVGDLMRDDQVMRSTNGHLYVVADNTGAAPTGCHGSGIGCAHKEIYRAICCIRITALARMFM